jgi:DNA modification methylase
MTVNRFLVGDALKHLRNLPGASVDTVITSPPYFLLRDYAVRGQFGMEANVDEWAQNLARVCREIARVLKPTGSLWLDVGDGYSRHHRLGAPPKSLLLAPERLLLRLHADGWVVRNKVAWVKRNPRPSSIRDRLTCSWEPIYLLVRSRCYFFDLDVIRRPIRTPPKQPRRGRAARREPPASWAGPLAGSTAWLHHLKAQGAAGHPLGANPSDVLGTAASNFRGAHFATFPPALVEPLLKATCPEKVCTGCGHPWERDRVERRIGELAVLGTLRPRCRCGAPTEPGLVLDPFSGAGTVALVAQANGRNWLGIDLNPAYVRLAKERLHAARAD